ncbi:MAG: cation:proton antiporter [Candidatus Nitrosocosmicus sp.]|jgi:Kef-type K+ transport system membrane component KefB|uniref:cation:proton antiporter n=1 Tax=Candidatus Nitrosocosmicus agrestis TaxID=2563600 RepID=UPI00122E5A74|nr:cation:proton antiporter [Candidatus Nitrosocosmicus sp. SS]KAA2283484.1 cation:proton antiporter [Candidatus Nitrosocosmicus sp. SS]KAF0869566.1 cation:proton antiporter [Candidatus Nitrosocosmicus sp. SS]MDR4490316.1 cation:proton antiporter [Candidatus Nitrosocosmicus sp.]
MAAESVFIHIIISLSILLFTAKIFAEIFQRIKQPVVLGELLAGIIVGPYALGGIPLFDGQPLVVLDETVKHIGELAAIIILFIAGLEITPREFLRGGVASFTVGALGVIVPFFVGFIVLSFYGLNTFEILLIATALTATSIAISIQVLTELGKMQSKEARLILGAAIVDDILAIAILSVVVTMVQSGDGIPQIMDIAFLILKILGLFAVLLISAVLIIPRILHRERLWRSKGSIEGITTAIFFGIAGLAAYVGLSPIVGAFAAGMAVASTKLIKQVEEYAHKLQFIFAPLFFAIIGAQVDLRGINIEVLIIAGIIITIAVLSKLVGCGLPSLLFLKDKTKSMRVGVGMISRGEVGLIVAGVGVSSGVLSTDVYTSIILMVAVTTIITPIWLKKTYKNKSTSDIVK